NGEPKGADGRRHACGSRYGRAGRASRRGSISPWLLLLAFFAEDILAAILDALALVGLGLAPAPDLGCELSHLLAIVTGNLDRSRIRGLHLKVVGNRDVDVVAVTELKAEILALSRGTIAD